MVVLARHLPVDAEIDELNLKQCEVLQFTSILAITTMRKWETRIIAMLRPRTYKYACFFELSLLHTVSLTTGSRFQVQTHEASLHLTRVVLPPLVLVVNRPYAQQVGPPLLLDQHSDIGTSMLGFRYELIHDRVNISSRRLIQLESKAAKQGSQCYVQFCLCETNGWNLEQTENGRYR